MWLKMPYPPPPEGVPDSGGDLTHGEMTCHSVSEKITRPSMTMTRTELSWDILYPRRKAWLCSYDLVIRILTIMEKGMRYLAFGNSWLFSFVVHFFRCSFSTIFSCQCIYVYILLLYGTHMAYLKLFFRLFIRVFGSTVHWKNVFESFR